MSLDADETIDLDTAHPQTQVHMLNTDAELRARILEEMETRVSHLKLAEHTSDYAEQLFMVRRYLGIDLTAAHKYTCWFFPATGAEVTYLPGASARILSEFVDRHFHPGLAIDDNKRRYVLSAISVWWKGIEDQCEEEGSFQPCLSINDLRSITDWLDGQLSSGLTVRHTPADQIIYRGENVWMTRRPICPLGQ
ncbi:hypothetical protein MMC10_005642 [Thelotrema lepadinum]|nr:hypothetical protein [Thelotrema lepadinum]